HTLMCGIERKNDTGSDVVMKWFQWKDKNNISIHVLPDISFCFRIAQGYDEPAFLSALLLPFLRPVNCFLLSCT
ncbi:MAG: hypothetical protein ABIQ02_03585, partial [Saprospiraceae bacterium]